MFPPELKPAFRAENGEFGWTREQLPLAVDVLRRRSLAILGGELWWVRDGIGVYGLIPQRQGPPAVYPWETTHFQESHGQSLSNGALSIRLLPLRGGHRQKTCHRTCLGAFSTTSPGFPKRSKRLSALRPRDGGCA